MDKSIVTKYLKDYQQPTYWVDKIALEFNILQDKILVCSRTNYSKNSQQIIKQLTIYGSGKLISVAVDDQIYSDYILENDELILFNLPEEFCLTIKTEIDAFENKSCMGLYGSAGNLFTQCEPEGFRKITYYPDRPDVMAIFTTTIIADSNAYPILLSNGNKISDELISENRRKVVWHDPFKKPSYLFALVAGKFSKLSDTFVTKSGQTVLIEIYSEENSISQCQHCLDSAKKAMAWDEQRFNLEYDLDRYMIVASGDFNMGAMENKGLNVFNTKYVLADRKTATDSDFINVEAVVGHEYFHNWTGNRVTCRDWFQLSLKEGLTVFRDQEFTSDLHSRAVKRIQDVKMLRQAQFSEDASPLAHPIRPESYIEMNNFYTMTVYEKGAEVVRMYQTILGKDGFRRGIDLYFARHDGYAVTCEDFCNAMADANQIDLSQFMLWYSQAGTPILNISDSYDVQTQCYTLTIEQIIPDTPGQSNKQAMLIPLEIGLIDSINGNEIECNLADGQQAIQKTGKGVILLLSSSNQTFIFNCNSKPTPSLLRGFSAPVKINYPYTAEQLVALAALDSDVFNRWEALQTLYQIIINANYVDNLDLANSLTEQLIKALAKTLSELNIDPSMLSLLVSLPSFAELSSNLTSIKVDKLLSSIKQLEYSLANQLENHWTRIYKTMTTDKYTFENAGKRALKNSALAYLMLSDNYSLYLNLANQQFENADNMTDKIGSLQATNNLANSLRDQLFTKFESEYSDYPLVMDKWFTLQSQSQLEDTLVKVKLLCNHPHFDNTNPNKLYSLIRTFANNPLHFNTQDGYQFIYDEILRIDKFNPSVAGRIAQSFGVVANLDLRNQQLAKPILDRLIQVKGLSNDVYEIISKTLAQLN